MRNLARDALELVVCGVSGMKETEREKDPLNYPRYDAKFAERLKTFQGIDLPVPAEEFALAGFTYSGPGDCVRVQMILIFVTEFDKVNQSHDLCFIYTFVQK